MVNTLVMESVHVNHCMKDFIKRGAVLEKNSRQPCQIDNNIASLITKYNAGILSQDDFLHGIITNAMTEFN